MTMAVGHIVHADQAEAILQEGRADLTALARGRVRERRKEQALSTTVAGGRPD